MQTAKARSKSAEALDQAAVAKIWLSSSQGGPGKRHCGVALPDGGESLSVGLELDPILSCEPGEEEGPRAIALQARPGGVIQTK
jgi:hypothetical protein